MKAGLEFAPGTTEDCQKLVQTLFEPGAILGTYRTARAQLKTGDIVLVTEEHNPSGFEMWRRTEYAAHIRANMRADLAAKILPTITLAHKSAHKIVSLPFESEAMWLVILRRQQVPIHVVVYVTPYEEGATAGGLILAN